MLGVHFDIDLPAQDAQICMFTCYFEGNNISSRLFTTADTKKEDSSENESIVEKTRERTGLNLPLNQKYKKCANVKIKAKNKKKEAQARYERQRKEAAKQRQQELEANQKQLEAGKWTKDQIMNCDLD